MTEKMLARVAVSSVPYAADRLYTYLVPDELIGSAEAGKRVTIPFGRGNRLVEGFLLEVGREAATSPLKPIDALLDDAPLLDAKDIRLVRWMKARYFCTYYDAIKTILPGGVWLRYRELWHVNGEISAEDALSSVAPDSLEEMLLRAMLSAKEIERTALDELGGEKTAKALHSLEACGLAVRETKLRQRLQDKSVRMVSLCVSAEDALAAVESKRRSAPVRYAVVELLSREGCLSSSEISYYTGATMQTLRGLQKAGLVEFSEQEVLRVSRYDDAPAREDIVLNGEQQAAFDGLCTLLGREGGSAALLHGVTASGKTQVYIRLIEEALTRGKTAMLLVPEIALTPQMLRRFTAQFGSDVAMLHSALPLTERYDQWKRIRRGEVRVVLGTRSAVFAPLQNLGLIILDEEQETSYQSENPPRYHARDVAQFRCAQNDALLLLVPEIALTPQMLRRFTAQFGSDVAMLHSALPLTERYDQWKRIRRGEVRVVLGTRSAVFAPLQNLGLIILDEEQETSYQSENPPRYHARDVAQFRCAQNDALLLLGSATPTIETAYAAKNGRYQVFSLHKRFNDLPLPKVLIADMKDELRQGNETSIGHALRAELEKNIERGEQSILFLNRRGSARMLLCGECGYVPQCPRCSVPMTYHSANERLMCHYCGHSEAVVDKCSECGGLMKRVGSGTQKVEQELFDLFPKTKVLRMDADTVGASRGHEALLREFEEKNIPILLGTQMVAKGLDFENVTLVGVLDADLSLYAQNYHAAERTYSLLAQVVGRAGRGERPGRAVIQTYHPENEVIQAAAKQDYETFYQNELRMRSLRRYPPFADLFTLTVSGLDELRVIAAARALCDALRYASSQPPLSGLDVEVLGPAGAPVVKVNNRYRYCVYLCGKGGSVLRRTVSEYLLAFYARKENRGLDIFADCNALQ